MLRGAKGKIILTAMLCTLCLLSNATEFKLKELLTEQDKLWENSAKDFILKCGWKKFKWNSAQKDSLYYSATQGSKVTLGKLRIIEIVVRFKANRLQRLEISLYNRGDVGELSEELFEKKIITIKQYLNKIFKYKQTPKKRRKRLAGSMILYSIWSTPSSIAKLRWSLSKIARHDRPEFISLYLYSKQAKIQSTKASVNKKLLPERLLTAKGGGKYINLPMVDQGAKGYCVVAVLERVMKYYGSDIDQHLLAELAKSSATNGTNVKAMVRALAKADSKLGVKFKKLYENRDLFNYSKFSTMLKNYNKLARKFHKKRLSMNLFVTNSNNGGSYDPLKFLYLADPTVFAKMRMKYYKSDAKRFFRDIEKYTLRGLPVIWCVQLGIFSEQGLPQTKGGHMRLITGFDRKAKSIFYSDSWGKGHELKKMPYNQAWAITTGTYLMPPRFQH